MIALWLVARGEYSDYTVLAAFTDESLATAFAEHVEDGYVENHVALLDALPPSSDWLKLTTHLSAAGRRVDADPVTETRWDTLVVPYRSMARLEVGRGTYGSPFDAGPHVTVWTSGTDHDRVRKVHTEATARALAEVDVLLAADPDDRYAGGRRAYRIAADVNADASWREVLTSNGWGAVATLLRTAGVDDATASTLAAAVYNGDPTAAASIDEALGARA